MRRPPAGTPSPRRGTLVLGRRWQVAHDRIQYRWRARQDVQSTRKTQLSHGLNSNRETRIRVRGAFRVRPEFRVGALPLISGQFFRSGMSSRFTGMGAGSAQWVVSSNPLELPDAPTRTVSTAVPAVSGVCSSAGRVAQTPPRVVSDRPAVGAAHRLAAFGSPVAARERHHARRFDRAPLAPNVGRDPVRDRAGVRTRRARQPAQAGPRPVPAVAGRYPANHGLPGEYVRPRLVRRGAAAAMVPLVRQAARSVLVPDRPVVRPGWAPAATTGTPSRGRRSWPGLTGPHPPGGKAWLGLPAAGHQRCHHASAGAAAPRAAPGQTAERAWRTSAAADRLDLSEEAGVGARAGGLAARPSGTVAAGQQSRSRRTLCRVARAPYARRGIVSGCQERRRRAAGSPAGARRACPATAAPPHAGPLVRRAAGGRRHPPRGNPRRWKPSTTGQPRAPRS